MPEKLLKSVFDMDKLKVGTPVKVTVYGERFKGTTWCYIIGASEECIEVGAFDKENIPTTCCITKEHILNEVVRIEVL